MEVNENNNNNSIEKESPAGSLSSPPSSPTAQSTRKQVIKGFIVALIYITLNITLSITNKWLFKYEEFHFPIYIILTGISATCIGSTTLIYLFNFSPRPKYKEIKENAIFLILSGASHGLSTALENVSIQHTSISLNQVIKASAPFFTMILSILFEQKLYTKKTMVITVFLVIGAALTSYHNPSFSVFGFLSAIGSEAFGLTRLMIDSRMLRKAKFHPMTLTMIVSYPAVLSLIPPFLFFEFSKFLEAINGGDHKHDIYVVAVMNWVAFAYLFTSTLLLSLTSAHFSQVISSFKVVLLVGVATQIFQTVFTKINLLGLFVTFLAFCAYSYLRIIGQEEIKPPNAFNEVNGDGGDGGDGGDIIELELDEFGRLDDHNEFIDGAGDEGGDVHNRL